MMLMKTESTPSLKTRPRSRRASAPEPLEARNAPATISWDGGGDGTSWNSANNWSGNTVPGSLDDVTIDFAGVTSVMINSGAFAVKSLVMNGDDVLNISGGSLALTSVSSIAHLNLTGALWIARR